MSGPQTAEELYLDLMKRVLTRLLFDEPVTPVIARRRSTSVAYAALKRAVLDPRGLVLARRGKLAEDLRVDGRDHPLDAETMIGMRRLDNLEECVVTTLRDGVPGDVLEAGVWRGGASIFMQAVLRAYGATDRQVWVCDSFAGLPPPDPDRYPADEGDMLWAEEHLAVSLEQVRHNFERYGLLDDNVRFVQGWFQETLPVAPVDRLAVLRADGDMYESTIAILDNLYPKVSPGGFVIIDDYGAIEACRRAVHDYRDRHGISEPIETVDWTGAYWRKAA